MKVGVALVVVLLAGCILANELPTEAVSIASKRAAHAQALAQAQAALEAGRADESFALFRRVLAADPGNRTAKYGVANSLILQNHTREAQEVLELLIKQFPEDYVVKNNAAWLYATTTNMALRNPQRAISLARDALLVAPDDGHVWSTLSDAHYAAGDFAKALRACARAVELSSRANGTADTNRYLKQLDKMKRAVAAFSLLE